jgi:hypothetical protein
MGSDGLRRWMQRRGGVLAGGRVAPRWVKAERGSSGTDDGRLPRCPCVQMTCMRSIADAYWPMSPPDVLCRHDQELMIVRVFGDQVRSAGGRCDGGAPLPRASDMPGERWWSRTAELGCMHGRRALTKRFRLTPIERCCVLPSLCKSTRGVSRSNEPCPSWPGKLCRCCRLEQRQTGDVR